MIEDRRSIYRGKTNDWIEGYVAGLGRALEIAKDYTGQGVCVADDIRKEMEK